MRLGARSATHEPEEQEAALERRTRSLELSGPLALILSLFALAIGIGALVIVLANGSDATSMMRGTSNAAGNASRPTQVMGSTASGGMMMGAGGHGKFTSAAVGAAAHGKIYVQLGDYWAAPTVASVRAGKVTFIARHEVLSAGGVDRPAATDEGAGGA